MSFLESTGWKKFISKAYGIGAAAVITGALFKIMHWPFSGGILIIGMVVEALIFFVSAFEPIPTEYHWENVHPELLADHTNMGTVTPVTPTKFQAQPSAGYVGGGSGFSSGGGNLDIDKTTTDELKSGIKKFSDSINHLSNISSLVDATSELTGKLHVASGTVNAVSESARDLSESYQKGVSSIQQFNDQSKLGLERMHEGYEFYRSQLDRLGQTMGQVNGQYELYLKETNKVNNDYSSLHAEMEQLINNVRNSVNETQKLGSNMAGLNNNVSGLNSIYGSMLTSVNSIFNK